MNERVILTDCDGVLCDWDSAFDSYAQSKGFTMLPDTKEQYSIALRYGISHAQALTLVTEFNNSAHIANLRPVADAQHYIRLLAAHGFRFIVVTAMGDNPVSKIYRANNLQYLYGDVFDDLICIPMGASKYNTLARWAGSGYFWIEDHMRQAEAGHEQGLNTVLISKPYNRHYTTDLFPRVSEETPWKDLYQKISLVYNLDYK